MELYDLKLNINKQIKIFLKKDKLDKNNFLLSEIKLNIIEIKNLINDKIIYFKTNNYLIKNLINELIKWYKLINLDDRNFLLKNLIDMCKYDLFEFFIRNLFYKWNKDLEIISNILFNFNLNNENINQIGILIQKYYLLYFNKDILIKDKTMKNKLTHTTDFIKNKNNITFNKIMLYLFQKTNYSRIYIYCLLLLYSKIEDEILLELLINSFNHKLEMQSFKNIISILYNKKINFHLKENIYDYILFSLVNSKDLKLNSKKLILNHIFIENENIEIYDNLLNLIN